MGSASAPCVLGLEGSWLPWCTSWGASVPRPPWFSVGSALCWAPPSPCCYPRRPTGRYLTPSKTWRGPTSGLTPPFWDCCLLTSRNQRRKEKALEDWSKLKNQFSEGALAAADLHSSKLWCSWKHYHLCPQGLAKLKQDPSCNNFKPFYVQLGKEDSRSLKCTSTLTFSPMIFLNFFNPQFEPCHSRDYCPESESHFCNINPCM